MWEIDFNALMKMLASVGAKLVLLAFLIPFLILLTASTYAIAASQLGALAGWVAATTFVVLTGLGLSHWLWLVKREKT